MIKSSTPKKILVTGAAGFIGSHLVATLEERGHAVIGVDNFLTGSRKNISPRSRCIEHDIIDPLYLDEAIDQIYNLACPASPKHYQQNSIRTIKTNTLGIINIMGIARKHGARVLQASTSEIYGDPLEHPQSEMYFGNVNSFGPRSCYDEGKRLAEALCFEYQKTHGMAIRVARIFNTYGPRMQADDGRVVSNFIVAALQGKPLEIYGDGSQTRSFCYITDMVEGLIRLMESDSTGPVNLGNPVEIPVKQLAEMVLTMIASKSSLKFLPLPQDDPHRRKPDIIRAMGELAWQPRVELSDGLRNTVAYFKNL